MSLQGKISRIRVADFALGRVQDVIADAVDQILSAEIIGGRQIDAVTILPGQSNTIDHGLGRVLRGYLVVRRSADCRVWDDPSPSPNKTLMLRTSATVTVSLWVY